MRDLSRLLTPKTLAVIGGKECERVVEQCDKFGFDGIIWPVHPTRETLGGRPCFRSVEDLPAPPDAAYVAVNRENTIDVVHALSERGTGGAVCYAAGFAEADNENKGSADLQNLLVEAAGDMPIIGPNCYGFINGVSGVALWPDQHGANRCDSGVAIITQSSNVAINLTMQKRGLPIAYTMTVGNQAQTGVSELALGLLENENVTALGLHIEGLDDVLAFERLAIRARDLKKPIVALKVGRSERAKVAALTHTASLAGSDIAHAALFKRLGIAQVESLDVFLETLKLLHCVGPLKDKKLLSLSCSGGEASLMADAAHGASVFYPPFTSDESAALKTELGKIVTIANPLDYNTFIWGNWPEMTRMFETALAPRFDLSLLVMDFPRADRCETDDWDKATDSFVAAVKQIGCHAAVVSSLPENMPEQVADHLLKVGIAPLCGLDTAIKAADAAAMVGEVWNKSLHAPLLASSHHEKDEALETLDENASKNELAAFGLVTPKGVVLKSGDKIDDMLQDLTGPLAVKALGLAHKTEAGGVALGLDKADDIKAAMESMSHLTGHFLLEEMAPAPIAELIVGVTRDPVCGLMLTLGAGGVLTEILNDTATLLLSVGEIEVREALSSLKIGKLLDGYRKTEATDIDALIANILCIANYACANVETLKELDVNPLFATQYGSIAVDALIVKRKIS